MIMDMMMRNYLWLKAIHIIAVISWMAGLLYLPRLFVYHTQVDPGSEADGKFKLMERRLLRMIMNPAMILSFAAGILLMLLPGIGGGWLHAKLVLVLLLAGLHGAMAKFRGDFERGENHRSETFYRVLNEAPTLLMILIVILVVVKPF